MSVAIDTRTTPSTCWARTWMSLSFPRWLMTGHPWPCQHAMTWKQLLLINNTHLCIFRYNQDRSSSRSHNVKRDNYYIANRQCSPGSMTDMRRCWRRLSGCSVQRMSCWEQSWRYRTGTSGHLVYRQVDLQSHRSTSLYRPQLARRRSCSTSGSSRSIRYYDICPSLLSVPRPVAGRCRLPYLRM